MKLKLEIALEHAVGFLSDPYEDVIAPTNFREKRIISTHDCVAFIVRPYFEGGAVITISSDCPADMGPPEFVSCLRSNNGVISFSDSRNFNYCMLPISTLNATVNIWLCGESHDEIFIYIPEISEY